MTNPTILYCYWMYHFSFDSVDNVLALNLTHILYANSHSIRNKHNLLIFDRIFCELSMMLSISIWSIGQLAASSSGGCSTYPSQLTNINLHPNRLNLFISHIKIAIFEPRFAYRTLQLLFVCFLFLLFLSCLIFVTYIVFHVKINKSSQRIPCINRKFWKSFNSFAVDIAVRLHQEVILIFPVNSLNYHILKSKKKFEQLYRADWFPFCEGGTAKFKSIMHTWDCFSRTYLIPADEFLFWLQLKFIESSKSSHPFSDQVLVKF